MVVLKKIAIAFICNGVKVGSELHIEQQLYHAIKNRHFSRPTFRCLDMIDVQFFKEIHEFCDTTRLLHKLSIHHWKLVLILCNSRCPVLTHGLMSTECCNMVTVENSYNLIAIMK